MAREWALRGLSEEDLRPNPKLEPPKNPKGKLENFWYHYKWHTIAFIAVTVVLSVLIAQMVKKNDPDYFIIFATQNYVPSTATDKIKAELETYGRDIDGDGKVEVMFDSIWFANNDHQTGMANQMKFVAHLSAVDSVFFILDKQSYEQLIAIHEKDDYKFFAPIEADVDGIEDDGRLWNWKYSELRKDPNLKGLPDDLYFGVRDISDSSRKGTKEMYEQSIQLLNAFITKKPLTTSSTTN